MAPSSNGEDTTLSRWRYEFDSRWGYKIIKKKLDSYGVYVVYYSMSCDRCKKIKAVIKYHGGNYCTWYCAKKKS